MVEKVDTFCQYTKITELLEKIESMEDYIMELEYYEYCRELENQHPPADYPYEDYVKLYPNNAKVINYDD